MMPTAIVLKIGRRFGKLTVSGKPRRRRRDGRLVYPCDCRCGRSTKVEAKKLVSGHTTTCGCGHFRAGNMSRSLEYRSWQGMMQRCYNKKSTSYRNYGRRGIKVFRPWHDFRTFFAYIGKAPSPYSSIERIRNHGDYKPGNVKWGTRLEQANNRRNNVYLRFEGKTQTIAQWRREKRFRYGLLESRIRYGWSVRAAITTPAGARVGTNKHSSDRIPPDVKAKRRALLRRRKSTRKTPLVLCDEEP